MIFLFWTFIFLIFYCYLGYPFLIAFFSKIFHKPIFKKPICPKVSIVISVYNEEDVIIRRIKNLLSLDYPEDKMEILIGSDASTDKTNAIIKSFTDNRIRFFDNTERQGKMLVINDLIVKANNKIIIGTDARQIFARDAVKALVANFADPRVGCVSGELILSPKEGGTAKGISLYWDYEKFIRRSESNMYSMLGATGAIYAFRKELFTEIPRDVVLDDMFVPLKIIQKGFRAIFDDKAKAYDEVADSPKEEHRRKARTLYGNFQIFKIFPGVFNPFKSPIAIQFFSHKLLRTLIPFFMIFIFLLNLKISDQNFYNFLLILQIIFYIMAFGGALLRHNKYAILRPISQICYIPYVFCLLNFSALTGFLRFIGSKQKITWEKARE